jgi:hypothetical protein
MRLLHQPLKSQERRALAEKHRKGGHANVTQAIVFVFPLPWIGKPFNS